MSMEYVVVEKDNNSTKIIKKVHQKLSVESVLAIIEEQLATLSIHNYTNIVQLHRFKYQKEHLKQNEIVISEDYNIKSAKVDTIHYWYDGPSIQFKTKFNFTNLLFHEYDRHASADWNFFATSHGNGENDGVGGDVKKAVWRKALQMKILVTNLNEFA